MAAATPSRFLAGRERYEPVLRAAYEQAGGGVVYGRAGTGKTYLLKRWSEVMAQGGCQTLAFAACAATSDLSLGVFSSALDIGRSFDKAHAIQVATQQLLERANGRPVAVFIDDAHLLDDASVVVVHQLLTALPDQTAKCSVWLSVRTGEPLDPTLVDLWKSDRLHRIDLDPLTASESHDVVAALLGSGAQPALADALHERSQGIALYIRELINDGQASGAITSTTSGWSLTGELAAGRRLTDLLRYRLDSLSTADQEMVELVALTEPLPVEVMTAAEGDRLDALCQRGFITVVSGDNRLDYLPGHPLLGEVALGSIPVPRQRDIITRFGERLAERDQLSSGLGLRAGRWALEGKLDLSAPMLVAAAREAMTTYDIELGTRLASAALELDPSADTHETLGMALHAAGDHEAAEEHLRIAQDAASDDDSIVRISHTRSILNAYSLGDTAAAIQLLNEAATAVSDPEARLTVQSHTSGLAVLLGSFEDVIEVSDELLERTDMPGSIRAQVLGNLAYAESSLLLFDDFDSHVKEAIAMIVEHRDSNPGEIDLMWAFISGSNICRGNFGEGCDAVEESITERRARGLPTALTAYSQAMTLTIKGDAAALDIAELALEQHQQVDVYGNMPQVIGVAAQAAAIRGDLEQARSYLERIDPAEHADDPRTVVALGRGHAAVLAAEGDTAAAAALVVEAAASARQASNPDQAIRTLHDAVRFGKPELAVTGIADMMPATPPAFYDLLGKHARDLMAQDAASVAACAEQFADMSAWLFATETWVQAAALASQLGATTESAHWAVLAQAAGRKCSLLSESFVAHVAGGLSPRVLDVALDAGLGLKSREIAEKHFISTRTVDNHLRGVYKHLAVGGRDDLSELLEPVLAPRPG